MIYGCEVCDAPEHVRTNGRRLRSRGLDVCLKCKRDLAVPVPKAVATVPAVWDLCLAIALAGSIAFASYQSLGLLIEVVNYAKQDAATAKFLSSIATSPPLSMGPSINWMQDIPEVAAQAPRYAPNWNEGRFALNCNRLPKGLSCTWYPREGETTECGPGVVCSHSRTTGAVTVTPLYPTKAEIAAARKRPDCYRKNGYALCPRDPLPIAVTGISVQ